LQEEVSGSRAFGHVEEIIRHHRIQASPGYRDAARYCLDSFHKEGLTAEVESYPANPSVQFWSQIMMQEWSCSKGELRVVEPEGKLLASYDECKISLIQRSISTPVGGVVADLVVLDKGDDEVAYEKTDLRGKLVLTDGDINKVLKWAVIKKGALGIISDRLAEIPVVRSRHDLPDARQYTSFWWTAEEPCAFGFVLSPRLGDYLRRLAAKATQEQKPLCLHAEVVSSFYDGHIENVSALIPGETDEEILLTAHLCHPQWSANDNASGVAVALETARALNRLVEAGKLPKPRRGIRFLLIPEMTGTYAYLASHEERAKRTLAGLNLDMVGEKQELTKGPLVVEHPPEASESFVGDFLQAVLRAVASEVKNFTGTASYALFKHAATPFSGGSDHYILSDPTVNIPSPMLIQWPDKFYHTSEDTLDKVDADMLRRVSVISGIYAYTLASADDKTAAWILGECAARFTERVSNYLQNQLGSISREIEPRRVRRQLDFWLARKINQMNSLSSLIPSHTEQWNSILGASISHIHTFMEREWERFMSLSQLLGLKEAPSSEPPTIPEGAEAIPTRMFPGPLALRGHADKLPASEREAYENLSQKFGADALRTTTCALYWADGQRSIREICDLVTLEMGFCNVAFMVEYMKSLHGMGLISFK
jgi:hypothetical protein